MVVVDELDNLKRNGKGDGTKARARETLKDLEELLPNRPDRRVVVQGRVPGKSADVSIEVLVDELAHVRLQDPDSELVDRALTIRQLAGRRVVVMTGDIGMALRARSVELEVVVLDYPTNA